MKLTVIFCNICDAAHVGGPLQQRRVTLDLTAEQAAALALRDPKWELRGPIFIEDEPAPSPSSEP